MPRGLTIPWASERYQDLGDVARNFASLLSTDETQSAIDSASGLSVPEAWDSRHCELELLKTELPTASKTNGVR